MEGWFCCCCGARSGECTPGSLLLFFWRVLYDRGPHCACVVCFVARSEIASLSLSRARACARFHARGVGADVCATAAACCLAFGVVNVDVDVSSAELSLFLTARSCLLPAHRERVWYFVNSVFFFVCVFLSRGVCCFLLCFFAFVFVLFCGLCFFFAFCADPGRVRHPDRANGA